MAYDLIEKSAPPRPLRLFLFRLDGHAGAGLNAGALRTPNENSDGTQGPTRILQLIIFC